MSLTVGVVGAGAMGSGIARLELAIGPDCVLASSASSLSPTARAAGLAHPERLVGRQLTRSPSHFSRPRHFSTGDRYGVRRRCLAAAPAARPGGRRGRAGRPPGLIVTRTVALLRRAAHAEPGNR